VGADVEEVSSGRRLAAALALSTWAVIAAPVAGAAVTFDGASTGTGAGQAVGFDHTVGAAADRYLLVTVTSGTKQPVAAVSYGGIALTRLGSRATADPLWVCKIEAWGLVDPPSGSHAITIAFGGDGGAILAGAQSYFGVDGATPVGPYAANDAWGATVSLTAPSAAGELLVDGLCAFKSAQAPAAVAGAGLTPRLNTTDRGLVLATADQPGAGSVMVAWTLDQGNSANWAIGAVSLRPAAQLPGALDAGATRDAGGGGDDGGEPDGAAAPVDGPVTSSMDYRVGCACRLEGRATSVPGAVVAGVVLALVRRARRRRKR
jgi:hypothetical protein